MMQRPNRCGGLVFVLRVLAAAIVVSAVQTSTWASNEDPPKMSAQQLAMEWRAAYDGQDFAKALELGRQLAVLEPKNAEVAYNNACAAALKGDKADAISWLNKSIENGMSEVALMTTDPDLKSIQDDEGFKKALDGARKNKDRSFSELKERVAANKPLIIAPEKADKSKPLGLIVTLHGFGSREDIMAEPWRDIADELECVIVSPRGPHSTLDGSFQWGDPDDADYVVMQAIEAAKKACTIDPAKIVLTGFSQGGYMTYNVGMRRADVFRGLIPVAGSYAPLLAKLPDPAPKSKPKVFIMVGSKDRVMESNKQAAAELESVGLAVKLNVYDGVGHDFPDNPTAEFRKALQFIFAP